MLPRRLLLIRHAQAADAPVDADRPLTGRGERRAGAIGTWIEQHGPVPDRVLVSPARRALQTWERASAALESGPEPTVEPRIYANTVEMVLAAVQETPDDVATVAVVGHNPSLGELAAVLGDGQGDPALQRHVEAGFATGGVAVFELPGSFADLEPGSAVLRAFAVPGR